MWRDNAPQRRMSATRPASRERPSADRVLRIATRLGLRFRLGCRQRSRRFADADDYRCRGRPDRAMLRRGTKGGPHAASSTSRDNRLCGMVVFEVALAAGARLGDAAWGGHTRNSRRAAFRQRGERALLRGRDHHRVQARGRARGASLPLGSLGVCGHLRRGCIDEPGIREPMGELLDGSRGARARGPLRDRRARPDRSPRAHSGGSPATVAHA